MDCLLYRDLLCPGQSASPGSALHQAQASLAAWLVQVPTPEICRAAAGLQAACVSLYAFTQLTRDEAAFGRAVLLSALL